MNGLAVFVGVVSVAVSVVDSGFVEQAVVEVGLQTVVGLAVTPKAETPSVEKLVVEAFGTFAAGMAAVVSAERLPAWSVTWMLTLVGLVPIAVVVVVSER